MYFIQSGMIVLKVLSGQSKEAITGVLNDGDFFGEDCLAGTESRTATAVVMSKSTILRIEKAAVLRALRDEPCFSELFIHYLLSRNMRMEENLVDQLFNYSEKRLARVLMMFSDLGDPASGQPVPKITQATLAEIVGTTRARISFFMNRFRKLGYIDYNPGLHVYRSLEKVFVSTQASEAADDEPETTPTAWSSVRQAPPMARAAGAGAAEQHGAL